MQEVVVLLGARLMDLEGEKRKIEGALEALGANVNAPLDQTKAPIDYEGRKPPKKRRLRKGKLTRADEAVEIVKSNGGMMGGGEIAKLMDIKPNYMYRVLNNLVVERRLGKDGTKYFFPKTGDMFVENDVDKP